jgi:hypothetical protein
MVLQLPPPPWAKKEGREAHYIRRRLRRRAGPIVVLNGAAAFVPRGARCFLKEEQLVKGMHVTEVRTQP